MCDLTLALTLGSTLLGAAGQIQQAGAQAEAQRYNASVQDMNATLADRKARDAIERGAITEQRKRQEVQQILGQQQAGMAANGVDLSFGSPLDLLVDTAVMGELDALTIRSNTYRESYDYQVEAVNQRSGATMSRRSADNAQTAGYMNAAGTILGGASKGYQQWKAPRIGVIA